MPGSIPASVTPETVDLQAVVGVGEPIELSQRRVALRRFLRHPGGIVGLVLSAAIAAVALLASQVAPGDPFAYAGKPLGAPSADHLFGTDNLGRDLVRAVVHGLRTSVEVVVWVMVITAALGVVVGAISGYWGGWLDDVLMRLTELFQTVPRFFLVLLVLALFGTGTGNLIVVLGVTSWPLLARVVRVETLSVREREFVQAARSLGASDARILVRHVLPNVVPATVVIVALLASRVILLEASLGFLGLGDPNVMSLGFLVSNAQRFIRVAWWMSVFPGAALAVAVLAVNLLADGLNDVLTPSR